LKVRGIMVGTRDGITQPHEECGPARRKEQTWQRWADGTRKGRRRIYESKREKGEWRLPRRGGTKHRVFWGRGLQATRYGECRLKEPDRKINLSINKLALCQGGFKAKNATKRSDRKRKGKSTGGIEWLKERKRR